MCARRQAKHSTRVILFVSLRGRGRQSRAISIGAWFRAPGAHPDWKTVWEVEYKEEKGFLEMISLGEEERAHKVSQILTILDEDLGAGETAMDGSHVQRTFPFFALWKHGKCLFVCLHACFFSVKHRECPFPF